MLVLKCNLGPLQSANLGMHNSTQGVARELH